MMIWLSWAHISRALVTSEQIRKVCPGVVWRGVEWREWEEREVQKVM